MYSVYNKKLQTQLNCRQRKNFSERNFPPLCRGKEYNRNLTENWVADANLPSKFPNFPKFFSALKFFQLYRIFAGCLKNPHEEKISRRKTSLNSDVKCNSEISLKNRRGQKFILPHYIEILGLLLP
jgi:hypothetical protein